MPARAQEEQKVGQVFNLQLREIKPNDSSTSSENDVSDEFEDVSPTTKYKKMLELSYQCLEMLDLMQGQQSQKQHGISCQVNANLQ